MPEKKYDRLRPLLTADIERAVKIESGHACAIKNCLEHTYLEIHHINENREDNRIENLILLCDKHHKMAHAGVIDRKALREYKKLINNPPLAQLIERFERLEELVTANSFEEPSSNYRVNSINLILEEARLLGDKLRGTIEGNSIADQLFELIRKYGYLMQIESIDLMVTRDDSYSRVGLSGLGVLYDMYWYHTSALGLVKHFDSSDFQNLAYYCALRENFRGLDDFSACMKSPSFEHRGLVACDVDGWLISKYPNRGPSAVLDCLVSVNT